MCDATAPFPINSIQELRKYTLLLLLRKQLIVTLSSLIKNYFTSSIIFPYFNTPPLHKTIIRVKIIVSFGKAFQEKLVSYRNQPSDLQCNLLEPLDVE